MGRHIKVEVWRALLAKSGNCCAYPGCNNQIVDEDNIMIGEMAHIEAAEEGGPRYNKKQTDDERNSYDNLIYLCPIHHKIIDRKVDKYSVEKLKEMKSEHEYKFKNNVYKFDYSKIYDVNEELQRFLEKVDNKSKENNCDMAVEINKGEKFVTLAQEIYEKIDFVERTSCKFLEYFDNLNENIIKFMEEIGYDTQKWKEIVYYDNPFINAFWETLAIGYVNVVNVSRIRLMQMEILYYSEYLKFNEDYEAKKRLEKIKKEFYDLAGSVIYND